VANILIIQTRPGIGDLCIFLSSMHQIAKKNENSNIFLLTKKRTQAKSILKDDNYIKNIFFIDRDEKNSKHSGIMGFFKLANELKKFNFDKVYIMHSSLRYFLLGKFLGAKKVYSYGLIKSNENISNKIFEVTKKWLLINDYPTNAEINLKINNNNSNNIIIGIGSSGLTRRWSREKIISLINKINEKKRYTFFLVAGLNEKVLADGIIEELDDKANVMSLCEKSIYDIMLKIKNSKLYVGTDSAFMHISAALQVKSFGLFGDTPVNYSEYSNFINPILPLGYKSISHDSNAMDKITVDHVFNCINDSI
tara:strand:- start:163 stop:1089 length:927 start_codon:yes stop_codon:yes gene_type:complete